MSRCLLSSSIYQILRGDVFAVFARGFVSVSRTYDAMDSSVKLMRVENGGNDCRKYTTASNDNIVDIEDALKRWEANVDQSSLSESHLVIHQTHAAALQNKSESYQDPDTGFEVFTILSHLKRGFCCGNSCRHCPYEHKNVAPRYRDLKRFNSAFYC